MPMGTPNIPYILSCNAHGQYAYIKYGFNTQEHNIQNSGNATCPAPFQKTAVVFLDAATLL